ncbi:hypothetical protein F2Q69_00052955 [Brassica cretica]|uniref:Uncharacterized protein n=1 Tax=Brassica cretica TaxID=69181 RepID=A0A8S9MMX1_BRACR|nr:hypothetical protein F2Q69_00052955 [Brassica cretica]
MKLVRYGRLETTSKGRRKCMDYCRIDVLEELGHYVATERNGHSRPSGPDARSLCSDRAERTLGGYVATKLWLELGRYVATEQKGPAVATIQTKLYLGNMRCDVLLTEHDLLRKDILAFCGDLDINFVVTVFDPNS